MLFHLPKVEYSTQRRVELHFLGCCEGGFEESSSSIEKADVVAGPGRCEMLTFCSFDAVRASQEGSMMGEAPEQRLRIHSAQGAYRVVVKGQAVVFEKPIKATNIEKEDGLAGHGGLPWVSNLTVPGQSRLLLQRRNHQGWQSASPRGTERDSNLLPWRIDGEISWLMHNQSQCKVGRAGSGRVEASRLGSKETWRTVSHRREATLASERTAET
jgi:hypothetical protein